MSELVMGSPNGGMIVIVARTANGPDRTPDRRSWRLPCHYCNSDCWVDPETLFGRHFLSVDSVVPLATRDVELYDLGGRVLCCIHCLADAINSEKSYEPKSLAEVLARHAAARAAGTERGQGV